MNAGTTLMQVLAGTLELVDDGNSLWRVGCDFLVAVLVAVPMGLWMGRVDGVFRTCLDAADNFGVSRTTLFRCACSKGSTR